MIAFATTLIGACAKNPGSVTGAGGAGNTGAGGRGGAGVVTRPWHWIGVVGTGQSLAVGQMGSPVATTTQPYHNLKLSTGTLPWPVDANDATLAMVPLVEPIGRLSTAYPSSWPTNIAGETPHASMANQVTALVQAADGGDYVGVHGEAGENGQGIVFLHIIVTHGESDAGNAGYEAALYQLLTDYQADIAAITGQTQKIQMIVSQQNSTNDFAASTFAAWRIGVDHPGEVVCSGPKYQYAYYAADSTHLVTDGYRQLGEKYGQVYFERVVLGRDWQPLAPTTVERGTRTVTVHFHVPVPPLAWETTFQPPHQAIAEWQAGKGFELRGPSGKIAIASVAITAPGDAVEITTTVDLPATGVHVGYALTADATAMTTPFAGTLRWGLLRDSDPFVGVATQKPQPNYAVAFEVEVP